MIDHLTDTNVGNIEYIRKADASDWLKQYGRDVLHGKYKFSLMYIWKNIMDLPSADVVQVIHAYWIDTENYYRRWRCSACSGHTKEAHPPFCPFCGAKMDGGKE